MILLFTYVAIYISIVYSFLMWSAIKLYGYISFFFFLPIPWLMETETVFDCKLRQEKPSCSLNTLLRNLNKIHNFIAWNIAFHKTLEREHNSAKFFATFNKECPFSVVLACSSFLKPHQNVLYCQYFYQCSVCDDMYSPRRQLFYSSDTSQELLLHVSSQQY